MRGLRHKTLDLERSRSLSILRMSHCWCHHWSVTTAHNLGTRLAKRLAGANCSGGGEPNTGSAARKLPLNIRFRVKAYGCRYHP